MYECCHDTLCQLLYHRKLDVLEKTAHEISKSTGNEVRKWENISYIYHFKVLAYILLFVIFSSKQPLFSVGLSFSIIDHTGSNGCA